MGTRLVAGGGFGEKPAKLLPNPLPATEFALKRDAVIPGAEEYCSFLDSIGDGKNMPQLIPEKWVRAAKAAGKPVSVLDVCSGPGNAGIFVDRELRARGIVVSSVTFLDANEARLGGINGDKRYRLLREDALGYDSGRFDLVVNRYSIYYFSPEDQDRMLRNSGRMLEPGGCLTVGSFGSSVEDTRFFTGLHKMILDMRGIDYEGAYMTPEALSGRLRKAGFAPEKQLMGGTTWNTPGLARKFGLSAEQKAKVDVFVGAEGGKIPGLGVRRCAGGLEFDMPSFTIHAMKEGV
jgi:SAM-dependent methyltransferase